MIFLINKHGHYFGVNDVLEADELIGVTIYPTADAMLDAVAAKFNESRDYISHDSIIMIDNGYESCYAMCYRGVHINYDGTLEEYISEYVI